MKEHGMPSYQESICPLCGHKAVVQAPPLLGVRSSKFHCSNCGANLKVRPTLRVLWGFVVALAVPTGVLSLHWAQPYLGLSNVAMAAINGGFIGGGTGYAFSLLRKGMVFSPSNIA
jgi:hypothetical protein